MSRAAQMSIVVVGVCAFLAGCASRVIHPQFITTDAETDLPVSGATARHVRMSPVFAPIPFLPIMAGGHCETNCLVNSGSTGLIDGGLVDIRQVAGNRFIFEMPKYQPSHAVFYRLGQTNYVTVISPFSTEARTQDLRKPFQKGDPIRILMHKAKGN